MSKVFYVLFLLPLFRLFLPPFPLGLTFEPRRMNKTTLCRFYLSIYRPLTTNNEVLVNIGSLLDPVSPVVTFTNHSPIYSRGPTMSKRTNRRSASTGSRGMPIHVVTLTSSIEYSEQLEENALKDPLRRVS